MVCFFKKYFHVSVVLTMLLDGD